MAELFSTDTRMKLKIPTILGIIALLAGSILLGWLLWQDWTSWAQVTAWSKGDFGIPETKQSWEWSQIPFDNQEKFDQILEELQAKSEKDRIKEQAKRLQADLELLTKHTPTDPLLARALYGNGWEAEVRQYRSQQILHRRLSATALILAVMGATVCLLCGLINLVSFAIRRAGVLLRRQPHVEEPDVTNSDAPVRPKAPPLEPMVKTVQCRPKLAETPDEPHGPKDIPIDMPGLRLLRNREEQDAPTYKRHHPILNEYCLNDLAGIDIRLRNLFADEPLSQCGTPGQKNSTAGCPAGRGTSTVADTNKTDANADISLTQSVQLQTEEVEQQILDFQEKVQNVSNAADTHTASTTRALQEMSAQISAIRDYAASQQDRVEKLQNGYDWNIIRQFGLRIIRCVDNLEQRISAPDNLEVRALTEIRDELLFALESSGIEQFMPKLHSPYRGQERTAEAVKEKEPCTDSTWTGRIAHVVKPGYQYVIDEENKKIVRTARVKLYG